MVSKADFRTCVNGSTYDSWNRVHTMTCPDGEVVTYHYNAAGQVEGLTSNKQGGESVIVYMKGSPLKDNAGKVITYGPNAQPGTKGFDYRFNVKK